MSFSHIWIKYIAPQMFKELAAHSNLQFDFFF